MKKDRQKVYSYYVTHNPTRKKYLFFSRYDISKLSGYGIGYINTRVANKLNQDIVIVDYTIRQVERLDSHKPTGYRASKVKKSFKQPEVYSIRIKSEGDIYWYITTDKKLEKSQRLIDDRGLTYTIIHMTPTQKDYAMFDLDAEYKKHITDWRNGEKEKQHIELYNELIEQILIPLKKRYAKSMGRNNIR
jgi:hypothetical protein